MNCVLLPAMKRDRAIPQKAERMPKPIAPNPWRRGRRRTGGQSAHGNGAPAFGQSQSAPSASRHGAHDDGREAAEVARRIDASIATHAASGNGVGNGTNANAGAVARRQQVIGLFADRASAELACRALADRGYRDDAIKLMVSEETCARHFSDYSDRAVSLAPGAIHKPAPRPAAIFSHRPKPCPATLDIAIYTTPGVNATATLAEILAGSGLPYQRIAEYEAALRTGSVLLSVVTRSPGDARLIEIEWKRSYRAEKVHS
jgi:hypothetical protein